MSSILSDLNYNENASSISARKRQYSDLSLTFSINPLTGDIPVLTDIDAVSNSIKNLILTNFYERPFDPTLASGCSGLLFENANMFTEMELKNAIEKVINNHEPRARILNIDINDRSDENGYDISVYFRVAPFENTGVVNFFLNRLR